MNTTLELENKKENKESKNNKEDDEYKFRDKDIHDPRLFEHNKVMDFLDFIFRKQQRKTFYITLGFVTFSFVFMYIKQKNLLKDVWFFHNRYVTLLWLVILYYCLIDRLKLSDTPQDINIEENENNLKYHNKFEIKIVNFLNSIIWSDKTYKLIALLGLTVFVQKYMSIRDIHPNTIINVIFSHNILTVAWFVTLFFVIYFSLLPNTDPQINFFKKRNNHAITAYLIALLAYYGLPLPVFWLEMFFPTYNLKIK